MTINRSACSASRRTWVAITAQVLVFPLFGFHAAPAQHLAIGAIFTGVSLIRSFALRRLFEAIRQQAVR